MAKSIVTLSHGQQRDGKRLQSALVQRANRRVLCLSLLGLKTRSLPFAAERLNLQSSKSTLPLQHNPTRRPPPSTLPEVSQLVRYKPGATRDYLPHEPCWSTWVNSR